MNLKALVHRLKQLAENIKREGPKENSKFYSLFWTSDTEEMALPFQLRKLDSQRLQQCESRMDPTHCPSEE